MLELVLGGTARSVVSHIDEKVIYGTLGTDLRSKPEANQPLSGRFGFIGADFKTGDPTESREVRHDTSEKR